MVTSYVGFRADENGLTYYGSGWRLPGRRRRARLTPIGLLFVPERPGTTPLSWDEYLRMPPGFAGTPSHPHGWWISPAAPGGYTGHPTRVWIEPCRDDQAHAVRVYLVDPFVNQLLPTQQAGGQILEALYQYLGNTPQARAGLGDPIRCARLVDGLRSAQLQGAAKHENADGMYVGQKGGIRQTMDKAVLADFRVYRGRPVAGETWPTPDELAAMTLERLPSWIDRKNATPEVLAQMATDWTRRTPWPFGALVTA